MTGREYPFTDSDIDCPTCGRWFHTTGDLIDHEEQAHVERP